MSYNLPVNSLNIKNFLIASILISSISINQTSQAFWKKESWMKKNSETIIPVIIGTTILGSFTLLTVGIIKLANHYATKNLELTAKNNGPVQCDILRNFYNDPEHNYANLKIAAKNLYFEQFYTKSTNPIEFNYPVVWLAEQASTSAYFLINLKEKYFIQLGLELDKYLSFLSSSDQFQSEIANYNIEKARIEKEKIEKEAREKIEQEKLNIEREKLKIEQEKLRLEKEKLRIEQERLRSEKK